MILAWALLATFAAVVFAIGGIRIVRYADTMKQERDLARTSLAGQAHETERLAAGLRQGCRVVRSLLESQSTDEGWEDAESFLTAWEGVADEETT